MELKKQGEKHVGCTIIMIMTMTTKNKYNGSKLPVSIETIKIGTNNIATNCYQLESMQIQNLKN
jgi:hypothetical protein